MQNSKKTIYIIGAGAIGKALAVFLTQAGKKVVLLRGHVHGITAHVEHIEVELRDGQTAEADIAVSSMDHYPHLDGILVITTKSYGNPQIASFLKGKTGNSPVVLLQNGLNVEAAFTSNAFPEIYRCVLFASSQYTAELRLRFMPASVSPIGVVKGSLENLAAIIETLDNRQLVFKVEETIQPIIWTKAIINSVFNSICPLLETDNGIFYRNQDAQSIARTIIDECIGVAANEGILLDADQVVKQLLLISKTSEGQLISTYQDLLHKRKTEIETLNITIAAIADQQHKKELTRNTLLLGKLIQLKSAITMPA
ncbi:2-dehydropantoate 2-reductase [Lacibacter cauensis]|uniref:2-dehydropantoate 2-reductase n=1 Tax=Lacibacter cauensis TaxID=510947 RepID=A0A562S925_9BACT|nr:2-dehydropantoate 2-reductase [Lacibacter cauensis]TWI77917.1 2-dehydropantoate 2-reductase [Lacibacter cauensis]